MADDKSVQTDICIEQTLRRSLKTTGGLTHGRGITEHSLLSLISTAPASIAVNEALKLYFEVKNHSAEQHVDMRQSRQIRDAKDRQTFLKWLQMHSPFEYSTRELAKVTSGRIA